MEVIFFLLLSLAFFLLVEAQCNIPQPWVDCGYSGISQNQCIERGCCWDSTTSGPWCHYGGASAVTIKTVHVLFACHLDVGFANTAVNIVNEYFDTYFPNTITTAQALEARGGPEQLIFTTHSYLVSLYVDCPPGYGLHCPSDDAKNAFIKAIQTGWVAYHAFPFNAEPEFYDPEMLRFGVELTHALDAQFGLPPRNTLSQRDVPGMTRSVIPYLNDLGIKAISVGVNGASTPPNVPRAFVWKETNTGQSIAAMWHPFGYGGYGVSDAVIVPGFDRALVSDWRGDNSGPPSEDEVIQVFAQVQAEFPNATVIASTFDDFVNELVKNLQYLPVIDTELGDTWVYGVPSDPIKVMQTRAAMRARTSCIQNKVSTCNNSYYPFFNFSRQFVKAGEHTWGEDVKTFLHDTTNWNNTQFEAARSSSNFQEIEASWVEQLNWAINYPLQALPDGDPLLVAIQNEFKQLIPNVPNPSQQGYSQVSASNPFELSRYTIGFDSKSGAISTFVDHITARSWANATNPLALLQYFTYSQQDYTDYINAYSADQPPPDWFSQDFGKPGMQSAHQEVNATLINLWKKDSTSGTTEASFLVQLALQLKSGDNTLHTDYGAPAVTWIALDIDKNGPINITLTVVNKTATRLAEGLFLAFIPIPDSNTKYPSGWGLDKLGYWVDPSHVQTGGAERLHSIQSGIRYVSGNTTLYIDSLDAPVVSVGGPSMFPTPTTVSPDLSKGLSYLLFDNTWGTNYVMWWPYMNDAQEGNLQYRFVLHPEAN